MVWWPHWLNVREFEQALGVDDGQGSLLCCCPWGHKESDTTEQHNCTELRKDIRVLENLLCNVLLVPTQKRYPFHYSGLECKSRKSRNIWNNRQIWAWHTEWSRAKAHRVLPREHTGHSKYVLPTREDCTHGQHQVVNTKIILITFFAGKDGEALYSQQKQDWELTVAQIMNSLLPNSDLNWKWGNH